MSDRKFPIVPVSGAGGKMMKAAQILCGQCGRKGHAHDTAGRPLPHKAAAVKFGRMGWSVGRAARLDRCPECRPSAIAVTKPVALAQYVEKYGLELANMTIPNQAEAPRVMSRDDRRIIFAKLDEVYVGEDKGYSAGWTDQRIANDLGIPRAWVELMRDENFGPVKSNEEIQKILLEIADLRKKIDESCADYETAESQASSARLRMLERHSSFEKRINALSSQIEKIFP